MTPLPAQPNLFDDRPPAQPRLFAEPVTKPQQATLDYLSGSAAE